MTSTAEKQVMSTPLTVTSRLEVPPASSTEQEKPQPEEPQKSSTKRSVGMKSILAMETLNVHEKLLVVLFLIVMVYFQCAFSIEDLLAINWLAVAEAVVISIYDFVVDVGVFIYMYVEQQLAFVNKIYLVASIVLGAMASVAFDYDTDATDRFVVWARDAVVDDAEHAINAIKSIDNFFRSLIVGTVQYFLNLPTLWQYIIGITVVTSLIKYGIIRYLISIQPMVIGFLLAYLPYYGPFVFFLILYQITILWRAKMAIRDQVIQEVSRRVVELMSEKTAYYSNLAMFDDITKDSQVSLRGYELDSIWPDVKLQIKKNSAIQLNDFYIRGEHVQYWGFKANNPSIPSAP